MQYNAFGNTGWAVSELCLGNMTWGTQNTQAEGFAQLDMCLDAGINIIDTAEMYPANPLSKETQGESERILGRWVAANPARRGDLYIATKVCGAGYMNVRDGAPISRVSIKAAITASLHNLQTDYIDLYQLHWPNRGSYHFRQYWNYDPSTQGKAAIIDNMVEVLETLNDLIKQGKIRAIGLSNETAWGCAQWMRLADEHGFARMASIQNEYSLLCRLFDTDLAEVAHNENIGLFCYSPLGAGILSGKYANGAMPEKSRATIYKDLGGRLGERSLLATAAYLKVAADFDLDPIHMALAWCRTRPFMASAIFGTRAPGQLERILASTEVTLSNECLRAIDKVHKKHPMPF